MGEAEAPLVPNGKSGTLWTAVGHIFCAVVGAGVLGLPNSVAWLGWVAGPICLIAFFSISMWSSHMLAQLYRIGNLEFARYHHLVSHLLGRRGSIAVATFQMLNLVLTCIAYSITGAVAMQTIANYLGTKPNKEWQLVLVMGALELVFSQCPSLEEIWWVSALGTVSSLGYVFIALVLGLVYSGNHEGTVGGRAGTSTAQKIFGIFNSLGNIAFAYGFAQVLLEIQDTLRQPPSAIPTMRKAASIAVSAAFAFYFSASVACYAALGNNVPGEVLTGFEMAPDWVMVLANFCIVIHMVSTEAGWQLRITAWQVWAQPVFESIESLIKAWRIKRMGAVGAAGAEAAGGKGEGLDGVAAAGPPTPEVGEKLGDGKAGEAAGVPQSPFASSAAVGRGHVAHHQHVHGVHHAVHHLPAVVEADVEGGSQDLAGLASGLSASSLRSRRVSVRHSDTLSIVNSAPIPDLFPPGWKRAHGSTGSLADLGAHPSGPSASMGVQASGLSARGTHGVLASEASMRSVASTVLSNVKHALGGGAMYHLDTGAANEHVPLNDQGYYLPFWQRLLIRSTYVLLCTIVACVVPFFNAIVGLVGAITYWPLSVFFPFVMYAMIFKPRGPVLHLMKAVGVVMFFVAICAVIGSVQNIIVSWSSYTFFS